MDANLFVTPCPRGDSEGVREHVASQSSRTSARSEGTSHHVARALFILDAKHIRGVGAAETFVRDSAPSDRYGLVSLVATNLVATVNQKKSAFLGCPVVLCFWRGFFFRAQFPVKKQSLLSAEPATTPHALYGSRSPRPS